LVFTLNSEISDRPKDRLLRFCFIPI